MPRLLPLAGVVVVTIEQAVAGPLCTRHLADLGADVLKIERVGSGDFARDYDSTVGGHSSYFVWLNRGKRSVAIDLKTERGKDVMARLLESADIFVSNLAPEATAQLIDDDVAAKANPTLIRCYISGFGREGPAAKKKAFDAIVQGEAGVTMSTGFHDEPVKVGVSLADVGAGTCGFALACAALFERSRTGVAHRVDVSLFDVLVEWMSPLLLRHHYSGSVPTPKGAHHASIVPYGPYLTSDHTWLNIAVQNGSQWRRFCLDVLRRPTYADDVRFSSNEMRLQNRDQLEPLIGEIFGQESEAAMIGRLEAADIPWGHLNSVAEVAIHPQMLSRNRWIDVELPDSQVGVTLADPFLIDDQAGPGKLRVPALGEHTLEVLRGVGFSDEELFSLGRSGVISWAGNAQASSLELADGYAGPSERPDT